MWYRYQGSFRESNLISLKLIRYHAGDLHWYAKGLQPTATI